ncbi:hypothetical protein MBOE_15600 [Mycolicibacterium boenickei]|uniref:Uncharacterized protein n=1 Tax=Mycolicibacterium boenickei TaxID=146017 RepID=A0ABN5Z6X9_9MYCO|nr:hypothetical protein MBOE_15600 [Mycolicibacterium boenickei]
MRFQIWVNNAPANRPPLTLVAIDSGMYSTFESRLTVLLASSTARMDGFRADSADTPNRPVLTTSAGI